MVRIATIEVTGGAREGSAFAPSTGSRAKPTMRIKYEVSAGGLMLRRRGGTFDALLIGRGNPRVWSLPKGHVESRETHEQAAMREVREETGCWGEVIAKLSDISFWFYHNRAKHKKSVHFFLMRYLSGDSATTTMRSTTRPGSRCAPRSESSSTSTRSGSSTSGWSTCKNTPTPLANKRASNTRIRRGKSQRVEPRPGAGARLPRRPPERL